MKLELRVLLRQELVLMLTAHLLLVQELKVSEALKGQLDQQELLALQAQPEQQVLLVLKVQQALTAQMALMAQQAHKDHKALPALKVHKVIQD
tara:strand:- start:296 stop:574 length:279 start_codon:yes stop_codon:yes gene_type:complete